jgi:hypothetical protein
MENFFEDEFPPLINEYEDSLFFNEPADELNDSIFCTDTSPDYVRQDSYHEVSDLKIETRQQANCGRKNRKDDFDYDSYIKTELSRRGDIELDGTIKKKTIQKIRNRMSAQRSRQRQKVTMQILEQENKELKASNSDLFQQLSTIQKKNLELIEKINKLEKDKNSDTEETRSYSSSENSHRAKNNNGTTINKGLIFLAIAAVACIFIPQSGVQPSAVKMSGVVPFIGNHISTNSNTQLKTIEDQCRKYCPSCNWVPSFDDKTKSIEFYEEEQRRIQPYIDRSMNTLVCFNPISASKVQDAFKVLIDSQTMSIMEPNELYLADIQKIEPLQ